MARIPLAWALRNWLHVGPERRGRRWKAVAAQDAGDARLGHGHAQLLQLTDDAQVAPAGVLPRQAHDQLGGLRRQRWTADVAVRIGPAPPDERPVPAKDRLGRDEERRPPLSGNQPGESGDERPIRPAEAGTGDLASQHGQLVAQHEGLCILGDDVHPVGPDQLDDAPDESVEEAERHGIGASSSESCLVKRRDRVNGPFRRPGPHAAENP